MLFHHQKMKLLVSRTMEVLGEQIREKVPGAGPIGPVLVTYRYPTGSIRGLLFLEPDARDPNIGRLRLGMLREGSDRMVSNYLLKGTRQEILDYLSDTSHVESLIETSEHLKEKL